MPNRFGIYYVFGLNNLTAFIRSVASADTIPVVIWKYIYIYINTLNKLYTEYDVMTICFDRASPAIRETDENGFVFVILGDGHITYFRFQLLIGLLGYFFFFFLIATRNTIPRKKGGYSASNTASVIIVIGFRIWPKIFFFEFSVRKYAFQLKKNTPFVYRIRNRKAENTLFALHTRGFFRFVKKTIWRSRSVCKFIRIATVGSHTIW